MLRLVVLLVLISSTARCQYRGSGVTTIRNGGKCEYHVKHLNYWYTEKDWTFDPSPIDTSLLHAALAKIKHGPRKPVYWISGSDTSEGLFLKDTLPPVVTQRFTFEDASNLAVLRYEWYYMNEPTYAYVAYFDATEQWYLLDNGWDRGAASLIENYNTMLESQRHELEVLSVECRAAMLVGILYGSKVPVLVVSSCGDVFVAGVWDVPNYEGGLFVLSTEGDTLVVPQDNRNVGVRSMDIDGVGLDSTGVLRPIQIREAADAITVCLTACWRSEITPWAVVFSKEGDLLTIGCTGESISAYSAGYQIDNNMFKYLGITNVRCGYEEQ